MQNVIKNVIFQVFLLIAAEFISSLNEKEEKRLLILAQLFRQFMALVSMEHSVHSNLFHFLCSCIRTRTAEEHKI